MTGAGAEVGSAIVPLVVQLVQFDGPRSQRHVEASQRASRERITPLVEAHPELRDGLLGGLRCVAPDGGECLVVIARDAAALDALAALATGSELVSGEDPALLPGPDRVLRYDHVEVRGRFADALVEALVEVTR